MKVISDREKLGRAFAMAASVVPTRSPKPILRNVKMVAEGETVTLMATDLEIGIRIELSGVTIETPGSAILPVDRMGPILRESSDEQLTIDADLTRVKVEGLQSRFQLPAENPDEFPEIAIFNESDYFEASARFIRELVKRTAFATDQESTRMALTGVLWELEGTELIGVGTDGRRMARQSGAVVRVGQESQEATTAIIPPRVLHLAEKALAENEEEVQLAIHENEILIKSRKTTIFGRLVEGRFPNWRRVFPDEPFPQQVEMAVGPLYSSVRQAAIVTSAENPGVDFQFEAGKVTISGHGAELGESQIEMPIVYEGPAIRLKMSPRFLSDYLRVLDSEQNVQVAFKDPSSPVVFSTEDNYAYVIMPLASSEA
jgi:DNA polymerase III subunit beta